jgi:WD40 repeat protein
VYGVAFNPVSKALATAHYDGTVMDWDIDRRGEKADLPIFTIPAHHDAVFGVAYSANGRLLATAGGRDQEKNIGIWEAATGKQILPVYVDKSVRSVAFSPNGGRLARASRAWLSLVDVETGKELRISEGDGALRVAFGPDGLLLAAACEGQTVRILDAVTLQELGTLPVYGGELWNVAFSPDGRYLATCSGYKGKGTIQIWDSTLWDVRGP